jgi:hypothetical protein
MMNRRLRIEKLMSLQMPWMRVRKPDLLDEEQFCAELDQQVAQMQSNPEEWQEYKREMKQWDTTLDDIKLD